MPGPSSDTVTEAVAGVRANARRRSALRRMADGVADEVDEDLDDRALLAARRKRFRRHPARSRRSRSSADDSSITTASAASAGEIDRAVALRRVLAHRANDRQQMAGRGGDVVAVACIIAAQRPVGALDDPLGAFDDTVERRAQHFVERMVESRDAPIAPRPSPRASSRAPSRESRRNCRPRQSPPRR